MEIRKIRKFDGSKLNSNELSELSKDIYYTIRELGFDCEVSIENKSFIRISNVRLRPEYWGYNISPYSGRRGRILNYQQWGLINHALNALFDKYWLRAKIVSLNGKFIIRDDLMKFGFQNWEDVEYENIGSNFRPIYRVEAWQPEDREKFNEKFAEYVKSLIDRFPECKTYIEGCGFYVLPSKYMRELLGIR